MPSTYRLVLAALALGLLTLLALRGVSPHIEAAPTRPTVQLLFVAENAEGTTGRFEVHGLDERALAKLQEASVRDEVLKVASDAGPGLLGTSGVTNGILWFRPRFPLAFDNKYIATFANLDLTGRPRPRASITVSPRRANTPPTTVTAIHPVAAVLPENVLRFYLQFSAPMRQGEAYQRVRILDSQGKSIDLPFLELEEELWDPTGTRLTLLIDPGRIKRGVKPREDLGPIFEAGKSYTLEVDASWPDATGRPLSEAARKSYRISAAATERVDPTKWNLLPPSQRDGSLAIRFPAPLDSALVQSSISIVDAKGRPVAGTIEMHGDDTEVRFVARGGWQAGQYEIRVGENLEDVAGNRLDRLFDTNGTIIRATPTTSRSFKVEFAPEPITFSWQPAR